MVLRFKSFKLNLCQEKDLIRKRYLPPINPMNNEKNFDTDYINVQAFNFDDLYDN